MNRRMAVRSLFVALGGLMGLHLPRWRRLTELCGSIDAITIMPDGTGTMWFRYHDGLYHSYEWTERKLWVDGKDLTKDFTLMQPAYLNKVWVSE